MLNLQKTLEREELLKRLRELNAVIAQLESNLRDGEARLPIEEQVRLNLLRLVESAIPEMAGKVRVEIPKSFSLSMSLFRRINVYKSIPDLTVVS
jgi:hypothetical protein